MTHEIESIDNVSLRMRDSFYMTIEATSMNPKTGKLKKLKQTRMVKIQHIDRNLSILNPSVTMKFIFYGKYYLFRVDKSTYDKMISGELHVLENVVIEAQILSTEKQDDLIHKYYASWKLKTLSLLRMIPDDTIAEEMKHTMIAYIKDMEKDMNDNQITKANLNL